MDRHALEPCDRTGHELTAALRSRSLSADQVLSSALGRIEAVDGAVHAFLLRTEDAARERAAVVDAALDAGREISAVAGVPFALKDIFITAGIRTTAGSRIL